MQIDGLVKWETKQTFRLADRQRDIRQKIDLIIFKRVSQLDR